MRTPPILLVAMVTGLLAAARVARADDSIRTERVKFAAGASSATVTGSLRGYEVVDYVLGAAKGQVMTVHMKVDNLAGYFNVQAPGEATAIHIGSTVGNDFTGTLAASGDYVVRVYLMRSAARRNERAKYTITFEITGKPDGT